MDDALRLKISLLPETPGVYRYYDNEGTLIYVGKAKNLRRRVSSYFNREHAVMRTNLLVKRIADMQYTVVNTEEEALDLEDSLIKTYQPHYNVLLKDDKSYPWICVSGGLYPRVFITRDARQKGDKFFGPYPKAEVARALIDTIRSIYPIRTCRLIVSRETIEQNKHRLCLQYHIKRCEGCCKGLVSPETYGQYIAEIRQILRGDTSQLLDYLMEQMQTLAEQLRFEEAEVVKRKYACWSISAANRLLSVRRFTISTCWGCSKTNRTRMWGICMCGVGQSCARIPYIINWRAETRVKRS